MPRPWKIIFTAGAVLAVLRVVAPDAGWWPGAAVVTACGGAVAMAWAAASRRPVARTGWALLALSMAIYGGVLLAALPTSTPVLSVHPQGPWFIFQVISFAIAIVGVVILIRGIRFGREVDAWLDAGILGIAGGIILWEAILDPAAHQGVIRLTPGAIGLLVTEAVLFMLGARLMLRIRVPFDVRILYGAVLLFMVGDTITPVLQSAAIPAAPWLQATWFLGYPAAAAIALHPLGLAFTARPGDEDTGEGPAAGAPSKRITQPVASPTADLARLALLGLALAVAPIAFIYSEITAGGKLGGGIDGGLAGEGLFIGAAALAMNTLALLRIANLLRRLREDVRQRALAEAANRRSEEQLRLVSELAPVGIFMNDAQGHSIYQNDRWSELAGLQPGAGLGLGWIRTIHPDDLDRTMTSWSAGAVSGSEWQVEHRFKRPDGTVRWVAVRGKPVRDDASKLLGSVGTATDITRLVEDRIAAEQREALVTALIEQSPVGIQVFGQDGKTIGSNQAMHRILGLQDRVRSGGTAAGLGDNGEPDQWAEPADGPPDARTGDRHGARPGTTVPAGPIRRAFEGETVVIPAQPLDRGLLAGEEPGKDVIQVRQTLFPVKDADGSVGRVIGFIEDVTAQVAADTARRELEDRMRETAKLEALGVLAGGIAHDFNNLLVAIMGHAGLARADVSPGSEAARDLAAVETAAQRAADLARQMLAYSGRGRFVVAAVSIDELLAEMADLMERSIAKNADLVRSFTPGLPPVLVDVTQIRQLALNLIINASDALGGRPGTIRLRTALETLEADDPSVVRGLDPEPGEYVLLEVSDTGAGMDRATLGRIFEPFYTTKEAGRGLGLSAALGIVKGHRGAIRVRSIPREGTVFQVLLRPAESVIPDRSEPCEAPRVRAAGRILLVDDEESVRHLGRRVLERTGFDVVEAVDGPEAIVAFAAEPDAYRAVLLDVTLPTLDGLTVLERIREIRPDILVVMSSGWSEEEVAARIGGRTGVRFLQKPYSTGALVAALGS